MPVIHHLVADEFGTHIGKHSERLKITRAGETLAQAPLLHLRTVTVASTGVSISADAIAACCERGIPIVFMDREGWVYASLYASGLTGTVLTRRAQLLAYEDGRGWYFARTITAAKIRNQAATLRYWGRNRRETMPDEEAVLRQQAAALEEMAREAEQLEADSLAAGREVLMGWEGIAARFYWESAAMLIPATYAWPGRSGRGASDPVNSLLNYGYGILYAAVERALILAGLDPYAGFLHADRAGKPGLVLDCIEEFRQVAVDRAVVGLAARGYSIQMDERGRLSDDTRRHFARVILDGLEGQVRYEGGRVPLRHALQTQTRHLATFLRGEREVYTPFEAES
jgi:CRISPR-associated protein Cas1